jgi:hypothetical protein
MTFYHPPTTPNHAKMPELRIAEKFSALRAENKQYIILFNSILRN